MAKTPAPLRSCTAKKQVFFTLGALTKLEPGVLGFLYSFTGSIVMKIETKSRIGRIGNITDDPKIRRMLARPDDSTDKIVESSANEVTHNSAVSARVNHELVADSTDIDENNISLFLKWINLSTIRLSFFIRLTVEVLLSLLLPSLTTVPCSIA